MKLQFDFTPEQLELLAYIKAPYSPDADYNDDEIYLALEEYIADAAIKCGQDEKGLAGIGEQLIDIVSYMAMISDAYETLKDSAVFA
ncbi:MAG: hypothetical protein FWB71_04040 [Defluviitaleaceae bacterium]|nr:hypothetical protein [Defluviitaleaceae bacterium]